MHAKPLIVDFLRRPEDAGAFSENTTAELLLRQARRAHLLSRVAELRLDCGTPLQSERVRHHLQSARLLCEANHRSVRWEMKQVLGILSERDIPVCLLKGSAYVAGGAAAARGRTFSDIDILVPKERLDETQHAFLANGWMYTKFDPYDQKYYRRWMHELPPLRHMERGTELDVHHTIVPPTAKINLDVKKIWATAIEVEGMPGLYVPSDLDLILHSAVHLFNDGEFENGLRDLSDIDLLIRACSQEANFWVHLLDRAVDLDLKIPLFHALRYASQLLGTPVTEEVNNRMKSWGPGTVRQPIMDALFLRGLMPDHPTCNDRWSGLARWLLYVRSHWLRMPPVLLVQHLTRKAFRRWKREG